MSNTETKAKSKRKYSKHGLTVLKTQLSQRGMRVEDHRTVVARALRQWREDLVSDLDGDVTTAQASVIDVAVRTRLLLDAVDNWLLS